MQRPERYGEIFRRALQEAGEVQGRYRGLQKGQLMEARQMFAIISNYYYYYFFLMLRFKC